MRQTSRSGSTSSIGGRGSAGRGSRGWEVASGYPAGTGVLQTWSSQAFIVVGHWGTDV